MQRSLLVMLCCVLFAAACSDARGPVVSQKAEREGSVNWRPCDNVQCATLSVPLDWKRPRGRHIDLALGRLPATGTRVGTLFTNPGGPGGSGVAFVKAAETVFPAAIRRAFDIISWDPRGTGASTPVKCLDNLDPFYAVNHAPKNATQIQQNVDAAHAFVDACRRRSGDLLPFMSTTASVHDMGAIRSALDLPTISYVGFSYGSYLGALYAAASPRHVRAMVLDGAVDPSLSPRDTIVQQAQSFEADLDAFFAHCRDDGCGFAKDADPEAAFHDLQASIASEPIPVSGQNRQLGPGEFDIAVASSMYSGSKGWNTLGAALAQAARGEGNRLMELSDQYTERSSDGSYSNETASLYATSCLDAPSPSSVAGVEKLAADAARVAPVFGASTVWLGLPCTFWPVPPQAKPAPVHAPGAPPLLVLGAVHDPATPYSWSVGLAHQLRTAHLVTTNGDSHTSYGRGDGCVDKMVDDYLLHLTVPVADAKCA